MPERTPQHRREFLVADCSLEAVWDPVPCKGFRRPGPGTSVSITISRAQHRHAHQSEATGGKATADADAHGAVGGCEVEAGQQEGESKNTVAAAAGGPATPIDGGAASAGDELATVSSGPGEEATDITVTGSVGDKPFFEAIEGAFGWEACHPIELVVVRMRRGETATVFAHQGPDKPLAFRVSLVSVMTPVPFEQLDAPTHKQLAQVNQGLADKCLAAGITTWAGQRYARAVQGLLLNTLLQAGKEAADGRELAIVLIACYVGLAKSHLDHASRAANPHAALTKASDAARRALEIHPEHPEALDLAKKATSMVKEASTATGQSA